MRADPEKARQWEQTVAEQAGSGQSAAAFCRERSVAVARFYQWRRRLRGGSAGTPAAGAGSAAGFVEMLAGSGPGASVVGVARIFAAGDAVAADMGGTTLDVAVLRKGFPELGDTGEHICPKLRVPLIGVGAPMGAFFPVLWQNLDTKVVVGALSPVANAVGAIAGDVMLRETARVRIRDDGVFACSWRGGSARAADLSEALGNCIQALTGIVRREAEANRVPFTEPAFPWSATRPRPATRLSSSASPSGANCADEEAPHPRLPQTNGPRTLSVWTRAGRRYGEAAQAVPLRAMSG